MRKMIPALLCLLCLILPAYAVNADSARAMLVYHAPSDTVLYAHDERVRLPMASTTKLMTALVAAERCDLAQRVEVKREWTAVEGSSMYLKPGEALTVRELLCGLLLASGNDAALALAEISCGSEEKFVDAMNGRAAELELADTHYVNPHGLHDEQHFTTAYDLARLMDAVLQNPVLREISAMRTVNVNGRVLKNHNRLLSECPGVTAGKTGYTTAAGRCLVTACEREGLQLICVTLSDREDWKDHAGLYDRAFREYRALTIEAGEIWARLPMASGKKDTAAVETAEGCSLCLPRGESVLLAAALPRFLYAPVYRFDFAGRLAVLCGETCAAELPLRYAEDVYPE